MTEQRIVSANRIWKAAYNAQKFARYVSRAPQRIHDQLAVEEDWCFDEVYRIWKDGLL